jgi:hypothetical protein
LRRGAGVQRAVEIVQDLEQLAEHGALASFHFLHDFAA